MRNGMTASVFRKGLAWYSQFYNSIRAPGTDLLAALLWFVLTLTQLNESTDHNR